ncbi:MAG: hemolysin III family protein [Deltaproteobacteria bacterium]|nr:hemolysin III family protein [Deltaproteobacteria bacterium]
MRKEDVITRYTPGEEIANAITHAIATGLSIAALVVLIVAAASSGTAWHIVSFSIFGSTLILLYLASTLYHAIPVARAKRLLKTLDHSAIFLLIAGTYTPFMLGSLRGPTGWTIFGVIWGLAVAGVILKCCCVYRFKRLSLAVYIGMGWLCLLAGRDLVEKLPSTSLVFLALGGAAYSLGVIFYVWKRLPYGHAIWHLFVIAGSVLHFFSVLHTLPA